MRRRVLRIAALALGLSACTTDTPSPPVAEQNSIAVRDAYATVSAAPETSAFYCTIGNAGAEPDTLLAVESSPGMAMLHTVVMVEGRSSMQSVPRLEIPARNEVALRPGGYHVMVTGLSAPLERGDAVEMTLTLARAGTLRFSVPVVTYTELIQHLERADREPR